MAHASKNARKLRRTKRELGVANIHLRNYQLIEENERLKQQFQQLARSYREAHTFLVGILAQNGDQEVTRGTLQQVVDDRDTTFQVDPKPGAESVLVVHLFKPEKPETEPLTDEQIKAVATATEGA